eukprot:Opistho-2@27999
MSGFLGAFLRRVSGFGAAGHVEPEEEEQQSAQLSPEFPKHESKRGNLQQAHTDAVATSDGNATAVNGSRKRKRTDPKKIVSKSATASATTAAASSSPVKAAKEEGTSLAPEKKRKLSKDEKKEKKETKATKEKTTTKATKEKKDATVLRSKPAKRPLMGKKDEVQSKVLHGDIEVIVGRSYFVKLEGSGEAGIVLVDAIRGNQVEGRWLYRQSDIPKSVKRPDIVSKNEIFDSNNVCTIDLDTIEDESGVSVSVADFINHGKEGYLLRPHVIYYDCMKKRFVMRRNPNGSYDRVNPDN